MTKAQRLLVKQSEKREKLNAILAKGEEASDDEKATAAKLRAELQAIEPELRSAIEEDAKAADEVEAERRAGSNGDGESAEVRALLRDSLLARYVDAAANQRALPKREAELSAAFKLGEDKAPWELLLPVAEERAATQAPATTQVVQQTPVLGRIFEDSDTDFLGVDTPMVGVGEHLFTTIATGPTPADVDQGTDISGDAVAAATWRVESIKPKAVSASYEWELEDQFAFAQLESSLRMDLREAMRVALAKRVVTQALAELTDPANPTTEAGFQDYVDECVGYVDGKSAAMVNQVRLLINAATYQHAYTKYRGTGDGQTEQTAAERLAQITGGLRVSAHLPAAVSDIAKCIMVRGRNWAVAPVWSGIEFVPDRVTKAASRGIVLTAIALVGFGLRRASGDLAKTVEFKIA